MSGIEAHGLGRRDPDEPIDYADGLGVALTPEEYDQLAGYEASRGQSDWHAYYTVGQIAAICRRLVGEINGDHWNVDDYTGTYLWWRNDLQNALNAVADPLRTTLMQVIGAIDDRFRDVTDPDDRSLMSLFFKIETQDGWWWRRIPKRGLIRQQLERASGNRT